MHMESSCLRESTSCLGQRMTELNRSINGVMIYSCRNLLLSLICLAQLLALARSPYITCGFVWMPFSLSLIMFAVCCFYSYNNLRLLQTYSAEMECTAVELSKNRQKLLELGMYRDAFLAEMAGIWAVPAWTTLSLGIVNTLFFVVLSVPLIYAEYSFECNN